MSQVCTSCGEKKDLSQFYIRKETGKAKTQCKRCVIDGKRVPKSETHKKCKHCGEEKPFSEYQKAGGGKWLQPYCKPCDSERKKRHYGNNIVKVRERSREYYISVKDKLSAIGKEKRLAVRDQTKERIKAFWNAKKMTPEERKRRKSECDRRYRINNAEKVAANKRAYQESGRATEVAKIWQKRKMSDPSFRIIKNLRGRIYVALKRGVKSASTRELLGCSIDEFKDHFQSLFTTGMNWEKYISGEIVIDHIKPCALFDLTKPDQQRECFRYTNLQPLWVQDNLKKGAKYNEE